MMLPMLFADLFATKGIEYLLVIGFLVALVVYIRFLGGTSRAGLVASGLPATAGPTRWFRLDPGLFYHQGHVVTVGLDDFAQKLVGRPAALVLPPVGTRLSQGRRAWGLTAGGKTVDMLSPVDGEVVEVNCSALDNPGLINEDPYGQGWLLKVRAPSWIANRMSLLSGKLAGAWLAETVSALQRRLATESGAIAQDGGYPVTGFARALSAEAWDELARDFLEGRGEEQNPSPGGPRVRA
jgi:glycine cleavage system H lipoate-binding protein